MLTHFQIGYTGWPATLPDVPFVKSILHSLSFSLSLFSFSIPSHSYTLSPSLLLSFYFPSPSPTLLHSKDIFRELRAIVLEVLRHADHVLGGHGREGRPHMANVDVVLAHLGHDI